jgi:hypothetical protein
MVSEVLPTEAKQGALQHARRNQAACLPVDESPLLRVLRDYLLIIWFEDRNAVPLSVC